MLDAFSPDSGMGRACFVFLVLLLACTSFLGSARYGPSEDELIVMPSEESRPKRAEDQKSRVGTRWAVLVAGSAGYGNYRHQADVCHAFQILKRGGLKEENIVVFMYDDIANSPANPRPGVIINSPDGEDVYAGVPKDYTGKDVTVGNFYAALLGNKSAITGGSGKVVGSGPDDHIFIFYSDHGGPGVLGMPTNPNLFANDFLEVLKRKHAAGGYREMVLYIEACESGSIFEGLLPKDLNIYVTTASNAEESSWGTYCPGMLPSPPAEFYTCLGDLYSVSWMEDSQVHNLKEETLKDQYQTVKLRTSNNNTYRSGSHVMQYGDSEINHEDLYMYMGSDPANENLTFGYENGLLSLPVTFPTGLQHFLGGKKTMGINQRDADLLYLWHKYKMANQGSIEKLEIQQEMTEMLAHRVHLDKGVELLGKLLFGYEQGPLVLKAIRPPGKTLVDDWNCLKAMVRTFESYCGSLAQYGMKHMRALANICNAGIDPDKMAVASSEACQSSNYMSGSWSPLKIGFSA